MIRGFDYQQTLTASSLDVRRALSGFFAWLRGESYGIAW